MKQTTQKFLAKLLVLLLVLGMVPEVWGTVAQASSTSTTVSNNPYLWDGSQSINNGTTYLSWSTGYGTKQLSVANLPAGARVTWTVATRPIAESGSTYIDGYISAQKIGESLYITTTYGYNNTYSRNYSVTAVVSTGETYNCTVYTYGYNYTGNTLASVSLYNGTYYGTYYRLGDSTGTTSTSVVSQLISRVAGYNYNTNDVYVQFLNTPTSTYGYLSASTGYNYYLYGTANASGGYLGNVTFTPTGTGTASFHIRLYFGTGTSEYLDGYIYISTGTSTVSGGDITYTGTIGENVYFDVADFDNFYNSKTGGTLSSVTFTLPTSSTGTLYNNRGTRVTSSVSRSNLDNMYFQPYNNYSSTVRINFTAYGTWGNDYYWNNTNYGYSNTVTGTVVINFVNTSTARDITYTPVGGSVKLNSNDFTSVYRDVVGSTAPSTLTIQFQDVPSNGNLTYNSTALRSSNIRSYRFTTTQLNSITYTSSSTWTDSIEYTAYTNNTARFTGRVVFSPSSASATVIVTKACSGSAGVAFNLSDFTVANPAVMGNTATVRFTTPSSGTLTYNGANVTYTGTTVPVSMMNMVYYRPNTGFNGTDRVAFICYDAANNQVGSGQVNIIVSGNATTVVNTVSQFNDVPAGIWYYTALSDLVQRGVVQGTGSGKAEPRGVLNYGQALKMILLAAGYPTQTEPSGADWAINYKTLAVQNNIVDNSISLASPITRDAVVEIAAKALKISPVTSNSPFTDSNNGYAIALNRTSPKIIIGNGDGTFNGSGYLLRQEVWMIVYRMIQYVDGVAYNNQMPDGL